MSEIRIDDLTLRVSDRVDPNRWDEGRYDAFVHALCQGREYQKQAIFTALRFLAGGEYADLRELARENFNANATLREHYKTWAAMERRLPFPDMLSCSLDLATGTGKSYALYGLAAILTAEGVVDRALVLCPSNTIERGLLEKFRALAADADLRSLLPDDAKVQMPGVISATETIAPGRLCVENYHATLEHVGSSVRDSLRGVGEKVLVLNDEAHHVASKPAKQRKWREFLTDPEFGFRRIVGVSGTCYADDKYFADVVSRYSLRQAIEDGTVKNVEYVAEEPRTNNPNEKWQMIYHRHKESRNELKSRGIRPLTIVVTRDISACKKAADDLRDFLAEWENISPEQAEAKTLVVTSASEHQANVARLRQVDSPQSKVEWVFSVAMLTEGWDVKNVFQIVPHEERAFNSKLLISQVLGRGLRVPENWSGTRPRVTVFNHAAWAESVRKLVDAVLESEQRVSSIVMEDSPRHFDLHNLSYERESAATPYPMTGEYQFLRQQFVDLPTVVAREGGEIVYEDANGRRRTERVEIWHKSFTVSQIAAHMLARLDSIDRESRQGSGAAGPTNYAQNYPLARLEEIVRNSVTRANIDPNAIPDLARQRLLNSMNVLYRRISKRVTYQTVPNQLIRLNTRERQADSCSAAGLRAGGDKTIFCHPGCANFLPEEQREFFRQLTDPDGDFSGQVEIISNDHLFRAPLNLAIADHRPERKFIRGLCGADVARTVNGWLKNTASGFYAIEYAWGRSPERVRRTAHTKRGMFSPDFFIKQDNHIFVVEVKGAEEVADPSPENVAKHRFATEHFERLNKWLERNNEDVRYHFTMLTEDDFPTFFEKLRGRELSRGFLSRLDVAAREGYSGNGNGNSGNE